MQFPPEQPGSDQSVPDLVITDPVEAASRLRAGGVIAIPTETVYGLAACANNAAAIARVFAIKGRPISHPLILHLHDREELGDWVAEIPSEASVLAAACWPGPLTLLLRRSNNVSDLITGGRDTVAVRVPAHALAQQVLKGSGPLVAPSANRFGHVSPTTAEHVRDDLEAHLNSATDGILDGGPCQIGVESTIVDCTVSPVQILRHGGISAEQIDQLLAGPVASASGPQRASGMLESHYAPELPVQLCETEAQMKAAITESQSAGLTVAVIDASTDLIRYARELYSLLREAENSDANVIIARLPPAEGLGHAIRDRLQKAAAPR